MAREKRTIQYICTWCGAKAYRGDFAGRPDPGRCPKRSGRPGTKTGHTWVVNRKI